MEVIVRPRAAGKTMELIKRASQTQSYIVCFSHAEATRVANTARAAGYDIPFPLTASEFLSGSYHFQGCRSQGKLLIDNLDRILQNIAKAPIEAVTFRTEYENEEGGEA